jgi:putative hydrolase of the HAD superfamily
LNLRGVLLDFGYTLAYIDEAEDRQYREGLVSILKKYGYHKTLNDFSPLLDDAYRSNRAGEAKTMYGFWMFLLNSMDMPETAPLIGEFEELRKRYVCRTIKLYRGVMSVLTRLKKRYRLALVSNCAVGLSDVIEALGLNSRFDCMVLSYEVGMKKPDPRIYLIPLQRLNLKPKECIFVSDEISDLEGAREVGLNTFLVRQGPHTTHEAKDPNFEPNLQCNCISEVTNFL